MTEEILCPHGSSLDESNVCCRSDVEIVLPSDEVLDRLFSDKPGYYAMKIDGGCQLPYTGHRLGYFAHIANRVERLYQKHIALTAVDTLTLKGLGICDAVVTLNGVHYDPEDFPHNPPFGAKNQGFPMNLDHAEVLDEHGVPFSPLRTGQHNLGRHSLLVRAELGTFANTLTKNLIALNRAIARRIGARFSAPPNIMLSGERFQVRSFVD